MQNLPRENYITANVNFSARTTSDQTQDIILAKLEKRKKGTMGPPTGKKLCVFVDDMNMPAKEKYGAQPPIEILRQWIDHGYWFDRKDTSDLFLQDVLIVGAMAPPGGGRNTITPRFSRHFNVVASDSFSDDIMKAIFSTIVDWHFSIDFEQSHRRFSRVKNF